MFCLLGGAVRSFLSFFLRSGRLSAPSLIGRGKFRWQETTVVDQREEEGDVDSSGCTLFSAVRQIGSVFNEGDRAREAKPRLDYRLPCISLASPDSTRNWYEEIRHIFLSLTLFEYNVGGRNYLSFSPGFSLFNRAWILFHFFRILLCGFLSSLRVILRDVEWCIVKWMDFSSLALIRVRGNIIFKVFEFCEDQVTRIHKEINRFIQFVPEKSASILE